MQPKIIALSAGLDWLTLTSLNTVAANGVFSDYMLHQRAFMLDHGIQPTMMRVKGYTGEQCGDWQFLRRGYDGHAMIRCAGEGANDLARSIIEHGIPSRCTRIDAQVTATFDTANSRCAQLLRRQIRGSEQRSGKKACLKLALYEGRGGDTGLSLGDRASAISGRFYDYEAKHCLETTKRVWRAEVEMKAEAATSYWEQYKLSRNPTKLATQTVNTRLQKWGVYVKEFSDMDASPIAGTQPASTLDKRKAYTKSTLIPHLAKSLELGLEQFLLEELASSGILAKLGLSANESK